MTRASCTAAAAVVVATVSACGCSRCCGKSTNKKRGGKGLSKRRRKADSPFPPPSDTVNILYIDEGQVAVHVPHARDSSKHASAAVPNLNRMVSSTCSGYGSDGHEQGGHLCGICACVYVHTSPPVGAEAHCVGVTCHTRIHASCVRNILISAQSHASHSTVQARAHVKRVT